MRKTCWFVLALAVCGGVSAQDRQAEESIVLPLPVAKVAVEEVAGAASFSGSPVSGRMGAPSLPQIALRVLLPPDVDLSSVRVTTENVASKMVPGDWDVAPARAIATLDGNAATSESTELVNGRDPKVYAVNDFTPPSFITDLITRRIRQWRIASIVFTPYRYNPVQRKLQRLTKGTLRVHFARLPDYRMPVSRSSATERAFRRQVESLVVNFDEMEEEYKSRPALDHAEGRREQP